MCVAVVVLHIRSGRPSYKLEARSHLDNYRGGIVPL